MLAVCLLSFVMLVLPACNISRCPVRLIFVTADWNGMNRKLLMSNYIEAYKRTMIQLAPMAYWIRRRTSNQAIVGSSPTGRVLFFIFVLLHIDCVFCFLYLLFCTFTDFPILW